MSMGQSPTMSPPWQEWCTASKFYLKVTAVHAPEVRMLRLPTQQMLPSLGFLHSKSRQTTSVCQKYYRRNANMLKLMVGQSPVLMSLQKAPEQSTHALQTDQCKVCPSSHAQGPASVQQSRKQLYFCQEPCVCEILAALKLISVTFLLKADKRCKLQRRQPKQDMVRASCSCKCNKTSVVRTTPTLCKLLSQAMLCHRHNIASCVAQHASTKWLSYQHFCHVFLPVHNGLQVLHRDFPQNTSCQRPTSTHTLTFISKSRLVRWQDVGRAELWQHALMA